MVIPRQRTWAQSVFGRRDQHGRTRPLTGGGSEAVSGSHMFGTFLRAAIAGASFLDIVVVGDSNAAYGSMGWAGGLIRALHARGASMYATGLFPGGNVLAGSPQHQGSVARTYKNATTGASPTANTIHCVAEQAVSGDSDALAISGLCPSTTFKPWGEASFQYGFLRAADTSVNDTGQFMVFTQPVVASGSGKTFMQVGNIYTYRVRYATFGSGSGQFKLHVRDDTAGTQKVESASFITTAGSGVGTAVAESPMFECTDADHTIKCGWAYQVAAKGPFASLFESVYTDNGTFSVSIMQGYSGATSTTIATTFDDEGGTFLSLYLTELKERQVAAGGPGRVAFWINFGINGGANTPTAATTIQDATRLMDTVLASWLALGYDQSLLCFVLSATHPTTADGDESTSVARMATIRAALDDWAADDVLRRSQVTVVNLEDIYSANQVYALAGYSTGSGHTGQAHLSTSAPNMYELYAASVITAAMEKAAMPNITEPLEVELRLVGGAGGSWNGGGGGGQVVGGTASPVYDWVVPDGTTQYTVKVGAKGTASSGSDWNTGTVATPGGASSFNGVVAIGGAAGGAGNTATSKAGDGANGGGGGYASSHSFNRSGRSLVGGYAGGQALHDNGSACPGGGGGGAGEVGQDTQSATKAGRGGNGISDSWDGTARKLGVGGPGGNGFNSGAAADATESGAVGGRQGVSPTSPTAGNWGSAGGGAGPSSASADGLDGVVQIKYPGSTSRLTVVSGNSPTTSTSAITGYVLHTFSTAGNSVVTFL